MPHGTIRSNQARSLSQLSANPCMVTPRATLIPMAPTFRSWPWPAPEPRTQTPLRPSTRPVASPTSAQTRISASSIALT